MSKKQPPRYEPEEKIASFVLRLPDMYNSVLEELVENGAAKSKNDLIVEIIRKALSDLKKIAEKKFMAYGSEICHCERNEVERSNPVKIATRPMGDRNDKIRLL